MNDAAAKYLERQLSEHPANFIEEFVIQDDPIPTGIAPLDKMLGGGIMPGGFTVVGGAPGSGKSAIGTAVCYNRAAMGGNPLYISIEMNALQVRTRMASLNASMTDGLMPFAWSRAHESFASTFITDGQRRKWADGTDEYRKEGAKRYVEKFGADDPTICSWRDMESRGIAQRAMVRDDISEIDEVCGIIGERAMVGIHDLVIVDYAQLVHVDAKEEYERVTAVSNAFRAQCKESRCPMLLISSLRNIQKSDDEPRLEWFRGSGHIGYDAFAAIVLVGGGYGTEDYKSVTAHVIKNRYGSIGQVPLMFCPKFNTIE